MTNNYVQKDYLGDLKASNALVEQIKQYYISRGISLKGVRFWVERQVDTYGIRLHSIRSNIVHNMTTMTMERGLKNG